MQKLIQQFNKCQSFSYNKINEDINQELKSYNDGFYITKLNSKVQFEEIQKEFIQDNKNIISSYCEYYKIKSLKQITPWFNNNIDKRTIAMWLAKQKIIPSKQFQHYPAQIDKNGFTVALILASKCMNIPKNWEYKEFIRDRINFKTVYNYQQQFHNRQQNLSLVWQYNFYSLKENTIAMMMAMKKIIPDDRHYHNPNQSNIEGYTVAMILAEKAIIPPKQWNHISKLINIYGNTVAMILAYNKIRIPKQWRHYPEMQNKDGNTVAMLYAYNNVIPPREWRHKQTIKNRNGQTVAQILASRGIIPPQEWIYDVDEKDNFGQSIDDYLFQHNIVFSEYFQYYVYYKNSPDHRCNFCLKHYKIKSMLNQLSCQKHNICKYCQEQRQYYTNTCIICNRQRIDN